VSVPEGGMQKMWNKLGLVTVNSIPNSTSFW